MFPVRLSQLPVVCCASLLALATQNVAARTLCVNPSGDSGCYAKISAAVNAAVPFDEVLVAPGTYNEDILIGKPLSLIGAGAGISVIDAAGFANGIFVDGIAHPKLSHVTIAGITVRNAQREGILVIGVSDVSILNNDISSNDKANPMFVGPPKSCPGQPAVENDETGDCGGGLHLIGVRDSTVSGNTISENAVGILVSDETGESHDILITHNNVLNNPLDSGIVLASHRPAGSKSPDFAPHFGIHNVTVAENVSANNGLQVGGAGVGLSSDGKGPGRVSDNVIVKNKLVGNGIGGISIQSRNESNLDVAADNMDGNRIIGNVITPGSGNCCAAAQSRHFARGNSGDEQIWGMVITENSSADGDVDIAVSTPVVRPRMEAPKPAE